MLAKIGSLQASNKELSNDYGQSCRSTWTLQCKIQYIWQFPASIPHKTNQAKIHNITVFQGIKVFDFIQQFLGVQKILHINPCIHQFFGILSNHTVWIFIDQFGVILSFLKNTFANYCFSKQIDCVFKLPNVNRIVDDLFSVVQSTRQPHKQFMIRVLFEYLVE